MTGSITILNRHHYPDGLPDNSMYIGRGTPFGNPYEIKDQYGEDGKPLEKNAARQQVIKFYKLDVWRQIKSMGTAPETQLPIDFWIELLALTVRVYKGEPIQLACSCAPRLCHGDVVKGAVNHLLTNYDQWVRPFLPPEPPPIFKVGDIVTWHKCPDCIKEFKTDRVTGVSDDGRLLDFGYIAHPIAASDCELVSGGNA